MVKPGCELLLGKIGPGWGRDIGGGLPVCMRTVFPGGPLVDLDPADPGDPDGVTVVGLVLVRWRLLLVPELVPVELVAESSPLSPPRCFRFFSSSGLKIL